MPKQNRVTPFGDIIATPARGTFTGNRGVLHNAQGQIVRPYQVQRWLICLLSFKGRQRVVMAPGRWTELFFLDEATALAAGHRPCFECRREAYVAFREAWMAANPTFISSAVKTGDIDRVLHQERLNPMGEKVMYTAQLAELPEGTFVVMGERRTVLQQHSGFGPYLLWQGALFPWSPEGYGKPESKVQNQAVEVLTPRSTVAALAHGYVPQVHETAREIGSFGFRESIA